MKMVQSTDEGDWEIFHNKMKGSFDTLTDIMDNLQMIGLEKTKGEDEKYLGYTSRLKRMIAKIEHIRATWHCLKCQDLHNRPVSSRKDNAHVAGKHISFQIVRNSKI